MCALVCVCAECVRAAGRVELGEGQSGSEREEGKGRDRRDQMRGERAQSTAPQSHFPVEVFPDKRHWGKTRPRRKERH